MEVDKQVHAKITLSPRKDPRLGSLVGPRNGLDLNENGKFVTMLGIGPLLLGRSGRRLLTISTALLGHIIQNATLNVV